MRNALRRALNEAEAGFTLVEVVTACVILGILSSVVLGIILQTQAQSVSNRARVAASNLAAREIDLVRDEFHRKKTAPTEIAGAGTVVNPHALDGQVAGQPLVMDGKKFTVTRSVQWNITGTGQSACDGGSLLVYPTLGVTVTVTWPNMGNIKPVVSTEALAPDKGSGIPATDSFIAIKVSDQDGDPSVGRTVKVQGGGQTKNGTTDATGCAVVEVTPAAGATGTTYSATVTDSGYVDISSTANPTKNVGNVTQGQLNNNVIFQVAHAGRAFIHLIDSNGNPVLAPPADAKVTLDAAEYSGSGPGTAYSATGSVTEIDNLWPTNYGAYYGTTPPAGAFERKDLEPGGTIELNAVLELGNTSVNGLPAGTVVKVVAGDAASCTGATVVGTADGSGTVPVSLPPGEWSFFATFPSVDCSPGPDVSLVPGANGAISWSFSHFTVSGAPTGSTVYVAEASKVTVPTTCPPATQAGAAITVPPEGVDLPAGNWYVWGTSGTLCAKPSSGASVQLTYDQDLALSWGSHSVTLTITGVRYIGSVNTGTSRNPKYTYYWPTIYVTKTPISGLTCSSSGVKVTAGGLGLTNWTLLGSATSNQNRSASNTVQEGTWYVIANDQNSNSGQTRWTSPTCKLAGTVTIDSFSGSTSVNYSAG